MAKIIEAKAVISAEDKTGAVFDAIAKKIDQIGKTGKAAAAVDQISKALERAKTQMAAIDRFNNARSGIPALRARFNEAEQAVVRAAQAMKRGEGNATALARAYERAQSVVSSASRALERQQSAALTNKRALEQMGIPINRLVAEQDRLRSSVERVNSALDRQHGRVSRTSRASAVAGHAAANLGFLAGPGILHATKVGVTSGASIQSEVVKMRAAGIPEADINKAMGETAGFQTKYTNVSRAAMLERFKELRSVLLHPEEAHHLLETTVQANAAMNAVDRTGHMAEGLGFAIRGAEVFGLAQDPKRYAAYMDSFIKAQQVMGKTITPEQQYEFAKYTKASGATLSDRFKMTTGVSLAQELGGATTGVSIDQFVKQITGGFQGNLHSAAKEFVALGLADKGDFETTKTGEIKGLKPGRHVKGAALAQTDPDKYVYDYILPALEKAGITDQNAQIAQVRRMFPSGRAADVVSKLITQRNSFENHAKLYGAAQGLTAIGNNQSDPFVALNSLTTSLSNFAGTLTSPMMAGAASALSSMASSFGSWGESLSNWQKNNPTTAKVAGAGAIAAGAVGGGVLTYNLVSGLMSGFGLSASAVALDGSAAALTAAAAALGGKGIVGDLAGKVGAGKTAAASAGGGFLSKAWGAGALALPYLGPAAVGAGAYFGAEYLNEASGITRESTRARHRRQAAKYNWYGKYIGDQFVGAFGSPEMSSTMTYGTGVAGDRAVTVSGEVHGQAEVTVKLDAGFVQATARAVMKLIGGVGSNGPGSAGHSSPDATAASAGLAGP